jgi:hypothetical protein
MCDCTGKKLFWKFAVHPLILRFAELYNVIEYPRLSAVNYGLDVRKLQIGYIHTVLKQRDRVTDRAYAPILWIDDISVVSSMLRIVQKTKVDPVGRINPTSGSADAVRSSGSVVGESAQYVSVQDSEYVRLNTTFKYAPASVVHFSLKQMLVKGIEILSKQFSTSDLDQFKYYLSEDRIYRHIITQVITWVHLTLEGLAFRDDWQFFRGRSNFGGISHSSILYGILRSVIIFLYLYDNDSSWVVLFTLARDILYSIWKAVKVLEPRIELLQISAHHSIPVLRVKHDDSKTRIERDSDLYDRIATRHVGLALAPLILGTAIFSLLTSTYKSWWSWIISCLADSVYLFGFISLTPQLYINYRLKSVAHLPIRSFAFKIFNTFIDDVFAFLVKLPLKHKLMTLRDDLIFAGFLYQWWIYPADRTRPNEFGFQYDSQTGEGSDPDQSLVVAVVRVPVQTSAAGSDVHAPEQMPPTVLRRSPRSKRSP